MLTPNSLADSVLDTERRRNQKEPEKRDVQQKKKAGMKNEM